MGKHLEYIIFIVFYVESIRFLTKIIIFGNKISIHNKKVKILIAHTINKYHCHILTTYGTNVANKYSHEY